MSRFSIGYAAFLVKVLPNYSTVQSTLDTVISGNPDDPGLNQHLYRDAWTRPPMLQDNPVPSLGSVIRCRLSRGPLVIGGHRAASTPCGFLDLDLLLDFHMVWVFHDQSTSPVELGIWVLRDQSASPVELEGLLL